MDIETLLGGLLSEKDLKELDKAYKYLCDLGEEAKNIKTEDDAYAFAKKLGLKCTKEEFKEGLKGLENLGEQIKKEADKAEKQAKEEYLDAVAVYMTAEKRLKAAEGEYAKYSKELEAEFKENRKLAPEYVEKTAKEIEAQAKKMEEEAKKFYADVEKNLFSTKNMKAFEELSKNIEALGKRFAKAKTTKDTYEIAKDLGMDCTWKEFKEGAEALGIYKE